MASNKSAFACRRFSREWFACPATQPARRFMSQRSPVSLIPYFVTFALASTSSEHGNARSFKRASPSGETRMESFLSGGMTRRAYPVVVAPEPAATGWSGDASVSSSP